MQAEEVNDSGSGASEAVHIEFPHFKEQQAGPVAALVSSPALSSIAWSNSVYKPNGPDQCLKVLLKI